jgi:hypothetical protein
VKDLNKKQEQRITEYFMGMIPDQDYYDFIVDIIEEDGFIDEQLVSDYECRLMG